MPRGPRGRPVSHGMCIFVTSYLSNDMTKMTVVVGRRRRCGPLVGYDHEMKRVLLVAAIVLGACKDEPPPDPVCTKVMAAYDTVAKTLMTLATSAPAGPVALQCGALSIGIRGAPMLVSEELRPRLQPAFDRLSALAEKCSTLGHAATQEQLKKLIADLRVTVATTCSK